MSTSEGKKRFDCFLTHDWGQGLKNHEKVRRINRALESHGLVTWFDEDRIVGDVVAKMVEGIENSSMALVFITEAYLNKVRQSDHRDNSKFEFNHCINFGCDMIPIVMEAGVRNQTKWTGRVGVALGTSLYVDFSSAFDDNNLFDDKIKVLISVISKKPILFFRNP